MWAVGSRLRGNDGWWGGVLGLGGELGHGVWAVGSCLRGNDGLVGRGAGLRGWWVGVECGPWVPAFAGMVNGWVPWGGRSHFLPRGSVLRLRERVAHPTLGGRMCNPLPSLRTNGGEGMDGGRGVVGGGGCPVYGVRTCLKGSGGSWTSAPSSPSCQL